MGLEIKDIEKYSQEYKKGEDGFFDKVKDNIKTAGVVVLSRVLLLYYSLDDIPPKHKILVYGALGYFLLPIDLIPDIYPGIGFTDDLTAIMYAYMTIKTYISDKSKERTYAKLAELFPDLTEENLKKYIL